MYVVQSYYSTLLRHHFTIYEMRILLHIVSRTKQVTSAKGVRLSEHIDHPFCIDGINVNFVIPIKSICGNTHNYDGVKAALRNMSEEWFVEYYDKQKQIWRKSSLIYNLQIDSKAGIITFACAKWILQYITDFRNGGYRMYQLEVALSLRNPYSARLYLMMSSATRPIRFTVKAIKEILGIASKYQRPADFVKSVLEPARKELEKRHVNGFAIEQIKAIPGVSRSQTIGIQLNPVKREKKDKNIGKQIEDIKSEIPENITRYMHSQLSFTFEEIAKNRETIARFCGIENYANKFIEIVDRTRRLRKNKFYIIAAMKNEIKARESLM